MQDNKFTMDLGVKYKEGKSSYPDLIRLIIPRNRAIDLAKRILIQYEAANEKDNKKAYLEEIDLFGELQKADSGF